jgi:hypothetical protein
MTWQFTEASYRKRGSYRLTDEQRASHKVAVDVEVVSYSHERYENRKSNPDYTFYGYVTVFHGTSISKKIALEFTRQRIFWGDNLDFWLFQLLENQTKTINLSLRAIAGKMNLTLTDVDPPEPTLHPFPETTFKVETYGESQFKFSVYWLPFPAPFDVPIPIWDDDPSGGQDEYPEPLKRPKDDPYSGNPDESPEQPDNDPRDYDEANDPQAGGNGSGSCGQVFYEYRNATTSQNWSTNSVANGCTPATLEGRTADLGVGVRKHIFLVWNGGEVRIIANVPTNHTVEVRNVEVVRPDGFRLSLNPNSLSY